MRPRTTVLCAALVAGAALAAPGTPDARGEDGMLDYGLVQRTLPKLKELGEASGKDMLTLHDLVDKLDTGLTTPERKETRAQVKSTLEHLMQTKRGVVSEMRGVLNLPVTGRTDRDVMNVIHSTELHNIAWDDVTFRKAIKDLSAAMGVRIRMAYHVVQMNRVSMRFGRAPASTVLGSLCNYFELRYTVEDGEVILFKKFTPNEVRFLKYQEKHPDVRLKYWEREDASGEYKKEEK